MHARARGTLLHLDAVPHVASMRLPAASSRSAPSAGSWPQALPMVFALRVGTNAIFLRPQGAKHRKNTYPQEVTQKCYNKGS